MRRASSRHCKLSSTAVSWKRQGALKVTTDICALRSAIPAPPQITIAVCPTSHRRANTETLSGWRPSPGPTDTQQSSASCGWKPVPSAVPRPSQQQVDLISTMGMGPNTDARPHWGSTALGEAGQGPGLPSEGQEHRGPSGLASSCRSASYPQTPA